VKPLILVVDDEPDIRRLVREILEDEGYAVAVAKDGESARKAVVDRMPNLMFLDIWMPDVDGISLLREFIEENNIRCPVIMMSGHGTVEAAVEATRLGAFDFIEKPLSLSKLLLTVENALASGAKAEVPMAYHHTVIEPVELVGKSSVALQLRQRLDACAGHAVNVLILGEPGVGKAHCAKYIHTHSAYSQGPFIEVHTASLSASRGRHGMVWLLGQERAGGVRVGAVEQADQGSLYVDDIAELPAEGQAALYAVITSGKIFRCDGEAPVKVQTRVIAASRYDLSQEVRAGRFREDLYHVLQEYPIVVRPLREHSEDVTELIQYYVRLFSDQERLRYRNFSMAAQNRLRNHGWPGNVLELENLVHRLLIQGGDDNVELTEVESALDTESVSGVSLVLPEYELPLRQAREQFEKAYLQYHLNQTDGSVGKVAKLAGMERTHLYRKLRSLGIDTKHISQSLKDS